MPLFDNLGYGGEKNPVIFDIGNVFTKCGFGGENGPRCIIPSRVKRPKTGELVNIHSISDKDELHRILIDFVHQLYFRHVLVVPKERRVVIVESILTPSLFRETLAKVLFNHFEVPSVLFAPAHLMALFTLGVQSGLVMDCGYSDTVVLPVYEGVPIMKSWQILPLAGKAVHSYLDSQLKECATIKDSRGQEKPLSAVKEALDEKILEDIKVRCCFVTNMERAKKIHAVNRGIEGTELPPPPPDVEYPMDGNAVLKIPGKLREHAFEVLFEQDNDEQSVATLILNSLQQCPLDLRKTLAENIILIGGTSMSAGFQHRVLVELQDLITTPKYKDTIALKTFKFHQGPGKPNYVAWLGGAIFGALEVLASRSVSRDQYNQNNRMLPDWCSMFEYKEQDERSTLLLRKEASKDKDGSSPLAHLKKDGSKLLTSLGSVEEKR